MVKKTLIFFTFFLSLYPLLWAQQTSDAKPFKTYRPNAYWFNPRYDHYLKSGSFLYFENSTRFTSDDIPSIGYSFPFNKVYQMYFLGGLEYKATEHWYLGMSEKILLNPANINNYYTRFNLSHRGKIKSLRLITEGAFEHIAVPKSSNPNIVNQNFGRVSFSAALLKEFKIGKSKLYAIAAYRPYVIFDLVNDGFSAYNKRRFDKTELRFELGYFINEQFYVSLFGIRDTEYSYSIGSYNINGTPIVPEGRINYITPTFGMSLNYVFRAPEDYVPGFPIK